MTPLPILSRIRAVFRPAPLLPAQQGSFRIPDLERWAMPHRSVDMADWTVARNMATNALAPDRTRLLDLYDSILVDSHLASTMESRVLRVMRSRFRLLDSAGKPQPEKARMLEKPWFEDFLHFAAEAVFRGHTLIELGRMARPGELLEVNRIDPRNVLPWDGLVVRRQGDTTGYPFREAPLNAYLIEVARPDELGLLCDIAPVAIVKKYAVGSWSDYVHKYGIPPRWVKTNSRDARRFKQLETMMQQMLSSAYGVIEGDEDIQIMPTPGTDAHKVFDELIVRMNSEMSKRILGQDGTSDNKDASGTYGSLQVLAKVAEDRHQADKASMAYLINGELLPRLANLGYPFQGLRFEWDTLQDLGPMELVDAVSKLGMVFDIDPKHVEERTGIKILGARRMPGELGGDGSGSGRQGGNRPNTEEEEGGEDDEEDDGGTANAFRRPIGFRPGESLSNSLAAVHDCGCPIDKGMRAEAPALDPGAVDALLAAAHAGQDWSQPYFTAVATRLREGLLQHWQGQMATLDYDAPDHAAAAAMEWNVFRFSAVKTTAAIVSLNTMVRDSHGFSDFKRRVDESGVLDEYNKHKLAAEYQLAVNTGMQSSRYYRLKEDAEAMPYWEYFTQGDAQVRPAHAALDGKVFRANDPIWDKIYPPNGWNCRCTVLPVAFKPERVYTEQEGLAIMRGADPKGVAAMEKGGFMKNRALAHVVFDDNIAYRDELKAKEKKERNEAGREGQTVPPKQFVFGVEKSYGRKGMDGETLKAASVERGRGLSGNNAATAWFRSHAMGTNQEGRVLVVSDYAGRKVHLTESQFETHLAGEHRKDRHKVANLIPEVLKNPDEVWSTQSNRSVNGLAYVKFYKEGIMRVATNADDLGLRITTWTGNLNDDQRAGLLIKPMNEMRP